jgi:hypothetical protein
VVLLLLVVVVVEEEGGGEVVGKLSGAGLRCAVKFVDGGA